MSALEEAARRLAERRESAMRGLMEQVKDAGGIKSFDGGEIQRVARTVWAGLDIDRAALERQAVRYARLHSPAAAALAAAMPGTTESAVGGVASAAWEDGYVHGRMEEEVRRGPAPPAPSGHARLEDVRRAVWEEAQRAVNPEDADLLTRRVVERLEAAG